MSLRHKGINLMLYRNENPNLTQVKIQNRIKGQSPAGIRARAQSHLANPAGYDAPIAPPITPNAPSAESAETNSFFDTNNSKQKTKLAKNVKGPRIQTTRRRADRRANPSNGSATRASTESLDLLPQSLKTYLHLSYLTVFLLVIGLGGWTVLAKIQGAVIAAGQVAVDGKPKVIQHLDGGIISEISVKEGDFVAAGQTIIKLDATILNANLDAAKINFFENQALINRLEAEKTGRSNIAWSRGLSINRSVAHIDKAMSGQEQLFKARSDALRGEIAQFTQNVKQLKDEGFGIISEIDFTRSELNLVVQELLKMQELLNQSLVSRSRVTSLERDKNQLLNAIAKLETRQTSVLNSIREAEIKIEQVQKLRDEQVLTELRTAQSDATRYSEVLTTVSSKSDLIQIQAPVAGVVHEMTATTLGGVIAPGQEIMQIIPKRDSLIIKAQIMPKDIDQVNLGQDTNVIFSALKQSAAPELDGHVSYISADSVVDPITGSSYFNIEVSVLDDQLTKLQGKTLIPGMPADIFIQTQERSVFDYLTGPLRDTFKKTMRDG
jgi:HlyD family secretion protein